MKVCNGVPLLLIAACAFGRPALAQTPTHLTDASPHHQSFVTVAPGVRIEVLDWGGTGPPIVFLAGLGDSAHEYDDFAPRFRDAYHVYAITRRGILGSTVVAASYDSAVRAHDIIAVLDALHIRRAIFVGHSFGGDELSKLGSAYPARVAALIYLDAYDYGAETVKTMMQNQPPPAAMPPMTAADSASAAAAVAYNNRIVGLDVPAADVLSSLSIGPDGRVRNDSLGVALARAQELTLHSGERSGYAHIDAPALAIYTGDWTAQRLLKNYDGLDASTQAAAQKSVAALNVWKNAIRKRFSAEVKHAQVIVIPGANHYIFISNRDQVERAIRTFLQHLGLTTEKHQN